LLIVYATQTTQPADE